MEIKTIILLLFVALLCSCGGNQRNTDAMLNRADSLMETSPDSALSILESIPSNDIKGNPQKAHYALLKSMALDKNCVDTTSFEVLQPAIDYFLSDNKGTPNEKLRTLYYKGRIHDNRREERDALACYVAATDSTTGATPSPTLARAYTAKSTIYYNQQFYDRYVQAALDGAEIYRRLGRKSLYADNLTRAMDGAIILENKELADSLFNIIRTLPDDYEGARSQIAHVKIIYASTFLSPAEAQKTLSEIDRNDIPDGELLDMASAYAIVKDAKQAAECFKGVRPENLTDTLKYLLVESRVAQVNGDYKKAIESMRKAIDISDSLLNQRHMSDILYLEDKYKAEQKIDEEKAQKKTVLLYGAVIVTSLVGVIFIILYLLRRSTIKRLKSENEKYKALEEAEEERKRYAEVERERKTLENKYEEEVRNLEEERNIVSQLISENNKMTQLLNEANETNLLLNRKNEISEDLKRLLRERVGLINGLIASHITNNENYRKEIDELTTMALRNRKEFMAAYFEIFEKIYPEFMKLLNDKGLSEGEKGYVCLTAMGLSAKEVGSYLETGQYYRIAASIRTKLGLTQQDKYIHIFIRQNLDK